MERRASAACSAQIAETEEQRAESQILIGLAELGKAGDVLWHSTDRRRYAAALHVLNSNKQGLSRAIVLGNFHGSAICGCRTLRNRHYINLVDNATVEQEKFIIWPKLQ